MMRQLQGGAMPRHCRVGPLTPPFTDALGEDLRGDGVIKIGDARITHEVWRKSAAHVSRPGKATETHQMVMNQGVRHQAKLLQILDLVPKLHPRPITHEGGSADGHAHTSQTVDLYHILDGHGAITHEMASQGLIRYHIL